MPNNPEKVSFSDMYYYNVTGLLHLLNCAYEAKVKKIVVGSTFKEYGGSCADYEFVPTIAALRPTTPFACSRVSGFYAAQAFALQHDVDVAYVRFFNMYGDGENALDLWTALKTSAKLGQNFDMTGGEQVRDYMDVAEAAQQLVRVCESQVHGTLKVHHIASGTPVRLRDFADEWWAKWGAVGKINYGALPYRQYESMRIVAKL
jgi:dTDP-6-deoxy-L-talose 4-dehydrogenase (NAD+)